MTPRDNRAKMSSPVGPLTLTERDGVITALDWDASGGAAQTPVLRQALAELEAYFAGEQTEFRVPVEIAGTPFTRSFLQALIDIPFGETRSYGDLARDLGVSAQAIGQACGANRIAIFIPCHRVLGATNLGGFSGRGGVEAKVALLKLEGAASLLI